MDRSQLRIDAHAGGLPPPPPPPEGFPDDEDPHRPAVALPGQLLTQEDALAQVGGANVQSGVQQPGASVGRHPKPEGAAVLTDPHPGPPNDSVGDSAPSSAEVTVLPEQSDQVDITVLPEKSDTAAAGTLAQSTPLSELAASAGEFDMTALLQQTAPAEEGEAILMDGALDMRKKRTRGRGMSALPEEEAAADDGVPGSGKLEATALPGAFALPKGLPESLRPPSRTSEEGLMDIWAVTPEELETFTAAFLRLDPNGTGFVGPEEARDYFEQSGLPTSELAYIWGISDVDQDGRLTLPEFVCANVLVLRRLQGEPLPSELPTSLLRSLGMSVHEVTTLTPEEEYAREEHRARTSWQLAALGHLRQLDEKQEARFTVEQSLELVRLLGARSEARRPKPQKCYATDYVTCDCLVWLAILIVLLWVPMVVAATVAREIKAEETGALITAKEGLPAAAASYLTQRNFAELQSLPEGTLRRIHDCTFVHRGAFHRLRVASLVRTAAGDVTLAAPDRSALRIQGNLEESTSKVTFSRTFYGAEPVHLGKWEEATEPIGCTFFEMSGAPERARPPR